MMPKDVERTLGVSHETVRRWAMKGLLAYVTLPSGHRRYDAASVEALRQQIGLPGTGAEPGFANDKSKSAN